MNRDLNSAKALHAVGNENIEKFLLEFGGERIFITRRDTTDMQRVHSVMGEAVAMRLIELCGGKRIYIPKARYAAVTPKELLAAEPEANSWRVVSVCRVSRSTYFRVRKELKHGNTD